MTSTRTTRWCLAWSALALVLVPGAALADQGDPAVLEMMHQMNAQLAAMGLDIAVDEIQYFTVGQGRPADRILQSGSQWVAGDPRRLAQGDDITYLVDQSDGATDDGLTNADTEAAIDRSMDTWNSEACLDKVDIVKRADDGTDPDIFDSFFGFGGFGNPFLADIVSAGWLPATFFLTVTGSPNVLAFSVSFIFINPDGSPTDINGDNYADRALNEVYYNDGFVWGIDVPLGSGFDVETVALHENGHSLGVGHFGPPPAAVMNPVYAGINQDPDPIDQAGMCTLWAQWPN